MLHQHPLRVPTRLVALASPVKPLPCPICGFYFPTKRALRIHAALKHKSEPPMNSPTPQSKPKPSPRPQSAMRRDFMQHSLQGLPTCKHCFWVFTSWPSFCMHFEKARCPVLHLGEMLVPTSRPATSLDSPQTPAIAPKQPPVHSKDPVVSTSLETAPEEILHLTPDPVTTPTAPASHLLNPNIKSTDFNYCLLCGRWLAHPGYLSRHVKSQHAEASVFHAAVLKWLDDRKTAILSPCQFCGADFKARKCSRPRHAKECPILYRAGLLLRLCASYEQTATASAPAAVVAAPPTSGHGDPHEG